METVKKGSKDVLYMIIPAYNESANIAQLVDDWYPVIEAHDGGGKSRMVIIDDGSKDDTFAILEKLAESRPLLKPITKPNSGHGATILHGYKYAISEGADYIFQTDSDGQTKASEFEDFWKRRRRYDMVIGWRRSREDGASRVFVTNVLRLVVRLVFGVKVRDANTPYRLMKRETLEKYINIIPDDYFLTNVVISVIFKKKNLAVRYLPITFRPRQGGVNSINIRKITGIGLQALKDFRTINRRL
ncbi:MAG: glycosyltransferase family 2 protein [Lachnospiraceae bacterium]|jgi:glycosyltransferase involved in cell wall biosynthesis|nr:glycosyltransferase family 2 protein [Lachnospiraceae bacterium]